MASLSRYKRRKSGMQPGSIVKQREGEKPKSSKMNARRILNRRIDRELKENE